MDLAKLVATCFSDEAKKEWGSNRWEGRLGPLDAFTRFVEAEAKKGLVSAGAIDAYCYAVSETPRSNIMETVLSDDPATQEAWKSGKWKNKVSIFGLQKKAEKLGRKLTETDIDTMVQGNEAHQRLVDEQDDPDTKPMLCEVPSHRGPSEPSQPRMKYIVYFDKDRGREVRKCHSNGGGDPIRDGEFLVSGVKMRRYCPRCKAEARNRNEEIRDQAFEAMNAGAIKREEVPPRLVWYTAAGAKRKTEAIMRSNEKLVETEEFENASISEYLEQRERNRRRHR